MAEEAGAPAALERGFVLHAPRLAHAAAAAVFLLTVVFAQVVSPLRGTAPVAYDTASIVLYFDRIINGRVLETFVPTTPKPLLGLVYGPLWELTHDWRLLTLVAVGVFATANALGTILGWRIAGPAAGLLAGVVMASSSMLMWEAVRGLAIPWATLGWIVAALAVTARPARWGLAGLALAFGTLARVETLAIVAAAGLGLLLLSAGPRRFRRPVPRRAWLLLIGLAAIPIMLVHDWLLVRDPLYWAHVSGTFSAHRAQSSGIAGVRRVVELFKGAFLPMVVMAVLAVAGMAALAKRSTMVAYGGTALAVGVAGYILSAGYLGYVVPGRYAAPILVTMIFAVAVAIGVGLELVAARLRDPASGVPAGARSVALWAVWAGGAAVLGVAALRLSNHVAPLDPGLRHAASDLRLLNQNASSTTEAIRAALAGPEMAGASSPRVTVPSEVWPRLSLELRLDLRDITVLPTPSRVDVAAGSPPSGGLVLYLRARDPKGLATELAVDTPTRRGSVTVVPIVADDLKGRWLVRLDRQR